MRSLQNPTEAELISIINEIDAGDGQINCEESVKMMISKVVPIFNPVNVGAVW